MSTEYVFDGNRGNYREGEEPNPNTHYGVPKFQAELAVAREASRCSIIMTSLVFAWPLPGRQNVAARIIDLLTNHEAFDGDTNAYRSPIHVEHLTESMISLIASYHLIQEFITSLVETG